MDEELICKSEETRAAFLLAAAVMNAFLPRLVFHRIALIGRKIGHGTKNKGAAADDFP